MTTLFIGNIYQDINFDKLNEVFKSYGRCKVDLKSHSYAFVRYEDRQDAILAMKNLNDTNLQGANGSFSARIEFSYKNKKGDILEQNFDMPIEKYENQSNHEFKNSFYDYSFKKEDKRLFTNIASQEKTFNDKSILKEWKNEDSRKEKRLHTSKSCEKMQVDDEHYAKSESRSTSKADRSKNNNADYYSDCFKESKNNDSFSSKEQKYERDYEISRNYENQFELQNIKICFICKLPGHHSRDCLLKKEFCFECGFKGHIARECSANVRNAKTLTEDRIKAILSQQMSYKYILPEDKIHNLVNHYKNLK